MPKEKPGVKNLSDNLKKLSKITEWFESQEDIDIEEGLKKVKEAVALIKGCKERLRTVENEFKEIKKEVDIEEDNDGEEGPEEDEEGAKNIPF